MAVKWTYILLLLFCLNVLEAFAGRKGWGRKNYWDSSEERDDDDDDNKHHHGHHHHHHHHGWKWSSGVGIFVLVIIILVICGLLSLVSWLSCKIYSKCRGSKAESPDRKPQYSSLPPNWSAQLVYQPELSVGFGLVSDGFLRVGPSHLVRKRAGAAVTDGASWAVAMTKGKHVFEITWPWGHRGSQASVGVGTSEASIKGKGSHPLVGSNDNSWGLDIVGRKARHANRPVMNCPTDGSYVPDKFLMYVDVDEGKLGFGNDVTYWGDVITNLPKHGKKPLHVMIGAARWQAEVFVQYKGSAPDGENEMTKNPHHLPPLFHARAPPAYMEAEETTKDCVMVQPTVPGAEELPEKPRTPPPPYARRPVGAGLPPVSANLGDLNKTESDLV